MKLSRRLHALRKKFPGVSQTEMGKHFGLKLRMYQRYETGEAEPEAYKMRRIIQRIEQLEKLDKLPALKEDSKVKDSGIHTAKPVEGGSGTDVDYLSEENKALKDEIRSLELEHETDRTTIRLLQDEIRQLKEKLRSATADRG